MIALLSTVLLASIVGSLHCAGMCGAFVGLAVNGVALRPARQLPLQIAYHGGRLITYTTLGALSGALGAALDSGGLFFGIQRAATYIAGGLMILFGLAACAQLFGVPISATPRTPKFIQRIATRGYSAAATLPPVPRSLAIGLLTTLLPCGWLYAFVITAAGAGTPVLGAAVMMAFWLGTLPMLAFIGIGVRTLSGSIGHKLPLVTSVALVLVGVLTVSQRLTISPDALRALRAAESTSIAQTTARAAALPDSPMPCCQAAKETPR